MDAVFGFLQRGLAGEHVVENAAEEVDVAARIVLAHAGRPLQRRVVDGPAIRRVDQGVVGQGFIDRGQSEVDQFGDAAAGDQDVAGFEIPMRQGAFEGVLQAAGDVDHQPDGLGRFDLLADLDEVPQVPALDEFHDEEMGLGVGDDLVDRHDILVAQRAAQEPLADELAILDRVLAVVLSQHLDRHDLAGLAVDGAVHPGERAAADEVEDLVVAEEEAGSFPLNEAVDLIVGHHLAADQELEELVDRDVVAAKIAPDLLQLPLVHQPEIERALSDLFGGGSTHEKHTSAAQSAGMDAPAVPGLPPALTKLSSYCRLRTFAMDESRSAPHPMRGPPVTTLPVAGDIRPSRGGSLPGRT